MTHDDSDTRSWTTDPREAAELGITHEQLRTISEHRPGPHARCLSNGAGNMSASMVYVTRTHEGVELVFMERDSPPLICRLRTDHSKALARSVHEARVAEPPQPRRYGPQESSPWAGVRATAAHPGEGSIVLECRFDGHGQQVWLPPDEVARLLAIIDMT